MRIRIAVFGVLTGAAVLAGCSDEGLPDATDSNTIDSALVLGSLRNGSLSTPSGYDIYNDHSVFTYNQSTSLSVTEFLYDEDPVLGPVLIPAQAESLVAPSSTNPGLMLVPGPFDSVTTAKSNGFILDAPVPVDSGDVVMLRSAVRCPIGVPVYGKLEVRSIDTVAHTIALRILVNRNCGYRSLEPGVPTS